MKFRIYWACLTGLGAGLSLLFAAMLVFLTNSHAPAWAFGTLFVALISALLMLYAGWLLWRDMRRYPAGWRSVDTSTDDEHWRWAYLAALH